MRSRMLILVAAGFLAIILVSCRRTPPAGAPSTTATPSTDIYLYRLDRGFLPFGRRLFNITNRPGYDNQPSWDGNDRLLYTSNQSGQADIYEIDFRTSSSSRVTATPESEYSPAVTPDGKAISVVRVERDSTQRLWRFPAGGGEPSVILENIKPVGYYAWLDSTTLALFVLGNPSMLQVADTRSGTARVVTTNIGRSIQRVPGGRRASYLHRAGSKWLLETVDPSLGANGNFDVDTVATMPDSADYVVWRSASVLYSAAGSRLLRLQLPSRTWEEIADLSGSGIRRITRLALRPDGRRIAIVADEPQ